VIFQRAGSFHTGTASSPQKAKIGDMTTGSFSAGLKAAGASRLKS
jgi:hypothetical protein